MMTKTEIILLLPWSRLRVKKENQRRTTLFLVILVFAIRCCSQFLLAAKTTKPCRQHQIRHDIVYYIIHDIIRDIAYEFRHNDKYTDIGDDIGYNIVTDVVPDIFNFTHTVLNDRRLEETGGANKTSIFIY